jgi:hypothetical protein
MIYKTERLQNIKSEEQAFGSYFWPLENAATLGVAPRQMKTNSSVRMELSRWLKIEYYACAGQIRK